MIAIMWQFDVKSGSETEFEQLYGASGEWTALNRHARSYLGSSFLRDQNRPSRYVVVEYWSEMIVYEQHRVGRSDAIASLEQRSKRWSTPSSRWESSRHLMCPIVSGRRGHSENSWYVEW